MKATKCFIVLCITDMTVASDDGRTKTIVNSKSIKLTSQSGRTFTDVFHDPKAAATEAGRLASLEPMKLFAVFESVSYFETTKPNVIEKTFNSNGEFVLKESK